MFGYFRQLCQLEYAALLLLLADGRPPYRKPRITGPCGLARRYRCSVFSARQFTGCFRSQCQLEYAALLLLLADGRVPYGKSRKCQPLQTSLQMLSSRDFPHCSLGYRFPRIMKEMIRP